jgi:hypothetical protein
MIIPLFYGCLNNELDHKEKFLGIWNDFNQQGIQHNNILFNKDSIIVTSGCRKSAGTWKADVSKIYICYNFKHENINFKKLDTISYRLNKFEDSLYIINKVSKHDHLLQKAKNNWEHYSKGFGFNIDLPQSDEKMIEIDSVDFFPNIFIGEEQQKIKVRIGLSSFKQKLNPKDYLMYIVLKYDFKNHHKINLIVDKKISEYKVDSIKSIIRNLGINDVKFFRVNQNKKANYGYQKLEGCEVKTKWNWWGTYDD